MGWKATDINYDDTLQLIALRHLGHAARWPEIALLNDLKPPYVDKVASDGVLPFGGRILLPIFQPDPISRDDDQFLTDIMLDDKGYIVVNDTDIETVSGIDNFNQAVSLRVVVSKTSLMFHPEYGCWAFTLVGNINTASLASMAAFYAKSAMLEDPRVKSVKSISAKVSGDMISIYASVLPVYGEAIAFERTF